MEEKRKNYLTPKLDSRASFYKKAYTYVEGDKVVLVSYQSKVCYVSNDTFVLNSKVDEDLLFSNTTLRHIKEFLWQQLHIKGLTKKDLKNTLNRVWQL